MRSRRQIILCAIASFVVVWLLAWCGFVFARNSKITAEKVEAFINGNDLRHLSAERRAKALRELAAKINSLSPEERRKFRASRMMHDWFDEMTESEKGDFIEETMPSGFKQMINAFEDLPVEKRKKAVDDAMKHLKEARESDTSMQNSSATNSPPLSQDLQKKVVAIGLKSFYSQSSAQTKAELAPVLEEMQKNMESGRMFR